MKSKNMSTQPLSKKQSKKCKASVKEEEKSRVNQENAASTVAEGTEHLFRTHICSECRRCFKCRSHLVEHMRIHFPDPSLQCPTCKHYFTSKSKLRVHMLRETGQKPHQCHLCDYGAVERNSLKRHLSSVHGHQEDESAHTELFKCRDETYLAKHMLIHSNDKQHMCSVCGYVTKWKHYLSVHMRKHAGDLRYKCNQCSYRCHRMDQLNSHKVRHQKKSLICEVCAYSCKRNSELRSHMQLKHTSIGDDQPPVYHCRFCSYTTKHRQALQSHENCKHTRTRTFSCALCNYTTFSNTGLFLHKKKIHGYMPGDVEWVKKYAEKEKEQISADLMHNFFPNKPAALYSNTDIGEESGQKKLSNHKIIKDLQDAFINENVNDAKRHNIGQTEETLEQWVSPSGETGNSLGRHSNGDLCNSQLSQSETANLHNAICHPALSGSVESQPLETISEPSVEEEEDAEYCDSEDHQSLKRSEGACLQLLRKQDKDQAEALVLEGRVQMLVVPTQDKMYHCNRCSYVTKKQAALLRHCKSSCHLIKADLRCQNCGKLFKQQRSLNTHRLRCLLLRKRKEGSDLPRTTANFGSPVVSSVSDVTEAAAQETKGTPVVVNAPETGQPMLRSTSESFDYFEEDGRYTCRNCPFSSVRKVTIDRHCSTCSGSTSKMLLLTELQSCSDQEENPSDYDPEGDEANEFASIAEEERPQKLKPRLSCPNCPFLCHQKRALASHELKGCLKRGEMQCQLCSFVAKSELSLNHHNLGHKKDKKAASIKISSSLKCDLCSFICKQERCLKQHVALKHEGVRPYLCRFCSFTTIRRYRLEAHESMHTGVGRHSCEICGQTFGTTSRLRLHHQRIHEKNATHFCSLCDYKAYNINDINRHNLSCHTGELSHCCNECDACFSSETALKQHRNRAHSDPNGLSCTQCTFTCRNQATLKAHVRSNHSGTKMNDPPDRPSKRLANHQCMVCSFSTKKRYLLVQHLLHEHEDGPAEDKTLKCDICGFLCTHQMVFDQHVRLHGGTCLFKCTECKFSTRNKQKITWHIRIHTGEKPYRCEKCNYSCADPSRLKYHMRIHMDERKYLCPECGYKCKWVNQLKYHMTKHTGAKPYTCEDCEYRTNRADALRIHRETRHRDVRSFICEKCGKAFKTRFLLKTHQRKHSEERPYVCTFCSKAFRWPAGLRHHRLTHTKQLPFYCLHCPYRAKQRFQVVKHLLKHHQDVPVQNGVGKDQEASSVGAQKSWIAEEVERQEDVQNALEQIQTEEYA
ncbi:hypothetical protein DNTS_009730 [Danionella cerebrum]|uniref:C2H2-type domain-containing protein n=1 Tax=Danionella cerebrum TaxID=2873325 RepID=A0A553RNH6_9TELE|nr:hypothetical protein DNTS_009730 [Danionella translucida]